MNPLQVYMCSPSWTLLPPPSPYHPSGSSQCTSPKHPVSCIKPGLAICFIHDILHVSMPFAQIFPPSPSPTESIRLFYTSVSLLLSPTQGYCYHLSKFHIYALVYCIGVFLSGLLHSVWPHRQQPTRLLCPWDSPGKNTGVGCHFLLQCMKEKSKSEIAQSCPTLSDPMDCSPRGSSIHGIFQARVLEWVLYYSLNFHFCNLLLLCKKKRHPIF